MSYSKKGEYLIFQFSVQILTTLLCGMMDLD